MEVKSLIQQLLLHLGVDCSGRFQAQPEAVGCMCRDGRLQVGGVCGWADRWPCGLAGGSAGRRCRLTSDRVLPRVTYVWLQVQQGPQIQQVRRFRLVRELELELEELERDEVISSSVGLKEATIMARSRWRGARS